MTTQRAEAGRPRELKLLVTGAGGMLGRAVVAAAREAGHGVVACDREALDVTEPAAVRARLAAERPDAVVNCAAYTDVDGAEDEREAALRVNGEAPGAVSAAATEVGAKVLHVSSDYVFDGRQGSPYVESDPPAPLSAYGESKLAGERPVAEGNPRHFIVRSAWLFGPGGRNFVDTMLRLAHEREEVRVVDDQVGSPTYARHLAEALVGLSEGEAYGLHHVAGGGACSWAELARETFGQAGVECRIVPVTTAEFPRPARRPAFSALRSERPDSPRLPLWQEGVGAHLAARGVGAAGREVPA